MSLSGASSEYDNCAFYIGLSPAPYFLAGLCSTLGLLAIAFRLYRNDNTIERGGMKSIDWFLPIYILPIGYVITVGLMFGIANMFGLLQLDLSCSIVKWFMYRFSNEGLAIFLMHNGIGQRPYNNALRISFAWACGTSLAGFLLYFLLGLEPYFIGAMSFLVLLLCFYLALALLPLSWLHRRPASVNFAVWNSAQLTVFIVTLALLHDPAYMYDACLLEMIYSFTGFLQPFIVLHTMRQDSLFWQGKYTDSSILGYNTCTSCVKSLTMGNAEDSDGGFLVASNQKGHVSGKLNEVMLGVWEFGRHTMDVFAESITTLERKVVPIIPFGMISVDTSKFFSGGTARVYKGKYDGKVVAVKFLFCIELTPERVADFCSEATLLNSVQHSNVVKCYGVSVMPPAICLVTEFCDHGSLYDLMHSSDFVIRDALQTHPFLAGNMDTTDTISMGGESRGFHQKYPSHVGGQEIGGGLSTSDVATEHSDMIRRMSDRTSGTDKNRISGFTFGGSVSSASPANSARNSNSVALFSPEEVDSGHSTSFLRIAGERSKTHTTGTAEQVGSLESSFAAYSANDIVIEEDSSSQIRSPGHDKADSHFEVIDDDEGSTCDAEGIDGTSTIVSDMGEGDTSALSIGEVDVSVLGPLPGPATDSRRSLLGTNRKKIELASHGQGEGRSTTKGVGGIEEGLDEPSWQSNSDLCSSIVEALDSMHSGSALSSANSQYGNYRIERTTNPLHAQVSEERLSDNSNFVDTAPATAASIISTKKQNLSELLRKSTSLMDRIGLKVAIERRGSVFAPADLQEPEEAESGPDAREIGVDVSLTSHASRSAIGNTTHSQNQAHVKEAFGVAGKGPGGKDLAGVGPRRVDLSGYQVMQNLSSLMNEDEEIAPTETASDPSPTVGGGTSTTARGGFGSLALWSQMLGASAGGPPSTNTSATASGGPSQHTADGRGDSLMTASHVLDKPYDATSLEEGGIDGAERGSSFASGLRQSKSSLFASGTTNIGDLLLTRQNSTTSISASGPDPAAFSSRQRSQESMKPDVAMGRASRLSVADVLPFSLRLRLAHDCAAGVASLHAKGIMHNDIKSLNFLVDKDLRVKLADLGESRRIPEGARSSNNALRSRTQSAVTDVSQPSPTKMLPQSINWSAPEVLRGEQNVSAAADVWSLTMVIAEILTGEVPFDSPGCRQLTLNEFLDKLEGGLRVTLPVEAETKHQWLVHLLNRGWSFHPEQRCTSIEMIGEIEKHLGIPSGGED